MLNNMIKRILFFTFTLVFLSISFSCVTLEKILFADKNEIVQNIVHSTLESGKNVAEAYNFTPEETYNLGRAVAASAIGNNNLYTNEELYKYLNSICQTIVINSDGVNPYKGYYIGVIDSNVINAFATPGGHILITKGMLNSVKSEDELAAVIAHEISHIQLEHNMKAIRSNAWTTGISNIIASPFENEFLSNAFSSMTTTLLDSGYSQNTEFEADENAIKLMNKTGYNPNAMLAMLENLQKNTSSNYSLGFGKTHPSPQQRINEANKVLRKIKQMDNYNEESRVSRFEQAKQYF